MKNQRKMLTFFREKTIMTKIGHLEKLKITQNKFFYGAEKK